MVSILGHPIAINDEQFILNGCTSQIDPLYCTVQIYPPTPVYSPDDIGTHTQFAYQADTGLVAILHRDETLEIRKREFGQLRQLMVVSVSDTLDSPIATMEWLPSFLYYFKRR